MKHENQIHQAYSQLDLFPNDSVCILVDYYFSGVKLDDADKEIIQDFYTQT